MNICIYRIMILCVLTLTAQPSWAGQVKVYVTAFAVTGASNRDDLKLALQTLMMSRLSGDAILVLDSPAGAELTVSGSYVAFGKIFSIDAVAKNSAGTVLSRAFIQGDNQEELIPAVGKLAKSLTDEILKSYVASAGSLPAVASLPREQKSAADVSRKDGSQVIRSGMVRPSSIERSGGSTWTSQRIGGALTGIAQGRILENGERELFVTGNRILRYYSLGKDLKLLSEISFGVGEKILSVDTADLDGDGIPEVYLTIMSGDHLISQVWAPANNALKKIADNLPYFLRSIALEGKDKKMYAQEKGIDGEFYGDVYELVKSGDNYTIKNPIKLPRFGNIFNFNRFADADGKSYYVVFNPDGLLQVYSSTREQLWKSSDKLGGSELYFQRPAGSSSSPSPALSLMVFLDPRISVTREGEIIVPDNGGLWNIGNSRSYSKSTVVAFTWNGSTLEEKWRTRQSQNYLADYGYDDSAKELLMLEVVQKEGLVDKGASAVYLKKVE